MRGDPRGPWDGPGLGDWDLRALVGHTQPLADHRRDLPAPPADHEDVPTPADYYVAIKPLLASTADQASIAERGRRPGRGAG